jgi:hypothetical protein
MLPGLSHSPYKDLSHSHTILVGEDFSLVTRHTKSYRSHRITHLSHLEDSEEPEHAEH